MAEAASFEEFVRTHATGLLRSATLMATSRDRGEELLQDTLAHLYPQWERVARADAPLAYVRRAMVNRLISSTRQARRREIPLAYLPEQAHAADPVKALIDRHAIFELLSHLPERQRAALVLRYFNDLPDEQIAGILGCREVTVRSLISRGLAELRRREDMTGLQDRTGA